MQVPTLYIAAQEQLADLQRLRTFDRVVVGQTVGSGHFHQFEVPEQVNAMIERFVALHVLDPVA